MPNIDIRLKRSKKFTLLMLCLWLGSLVIIVNLQIVWWFKAVFLLLTTIYGVQIIRSSYLLREIRHMTGNAWHLLSTKDQLIGELAGDSTVTRLVSILRFTIPQKRLKRSYVIFNDSMTANEYRRLIVCVKCYKP